MSWKLVIYNFFSIKKDFMLFITVTKWEVDKKIKEMAVHKKNLVTIAWSEREQVSSVCSGWCMLFLQY